VEAPSSFSGVLPLANFGTATITNAQATINGSTGAIDNSAWQNTAIDMTTSSGTLLDQTSGLTDSGGTSSFSVTYTGSGGGGGGHHHGHAPMETGEPVGPIQVNVPVSVTSQPQPGVTTKALTASVIQGPVVSVPAGPVFVAQGQQAGSASGLRTWWSH
jgi:hypothetical protein